MGGRFGSYLVAAELAITVVLLANAGLLKKSFYRLLHVDPGFNVRRLALVGVSPVSVQPVSILPRSRDARAEQPGALARLIAARVAALPGVEAVGYADLVPLGPAGAIVRVPNHGPRRPGCARWPPRAANQRRLLHGAPVHARARPLLHGRRGGVGPSRHHHQRDRLALRYFPNEDPLGHSIAFGVPSDMSPNREIVGVVADIKDGPPDTPAMPAAYIPFDQIGFGLVVR